MSTIYDVAKSAGVSKTLVSRVINNQKGVGEENKKRILEAIKKLNYVPNSTARSLVLQKHFTIGVILDSLCEPYFFDLIRGIETQITKSNYNVVFSSGRNQKKAKQECIDFFAGGRTDGIVIYGSNIDDDDLIKNLSDKKFPFIVVENTVDEILMNNIVVDNKFGSKLAIDHLVDLGCSNILHVNGNMMSRAAVDRKKGYEKAMTAHNLNHYMKTIESSNWGTDAGYDIVKKIIEANELPDAIYFGADNMAFGGMIALEEKGISIPEQIQIVGFDDETPYNIDRQLKKLTTVRQPLFEIGEKAIEILIKQIENESEEREKIVVKPKLVIRETTI